MKETLRGNKGFTLIELIIVIVILGILAAVALPKFTNLQDDAKKSRAEGILGALNGAAVVQHGKYLLSSDHSEYKIVSPAQLTASLSDGDGLSLEISGNNIITPDKQYTMQFQAATDSDPAKVTKTW